MVFTLEDSIVNRKNPADAEKCAAKLLNHFSKHLKSSPSQEPKIANRETVSDMFQCVEIMCAIGLGPIMHQIFDAVSEEREKLGRSVTSEETDIIIRRVFQEYKQENVANDTILKGDIVPKEDIMLKEEIVLKV